MIPRRSSCLVALFFTVNLCAAQPAATADERTIDEEAMTHFQSLLRLDTSDPPGNELPAVDSLKRVQEAEGIETKIFALDPKRPNLVARLRGNGS